MGTKRLCVSVILAGAVVNGSPSQLTAEAREDALTRYAEATWRSIDEMAQTTGLPADGLDRGPDGTWTPRLWTSPTNIGGYLWCIVAAEELKLISREAAQSRSEEAIAAIERLKKHNGLLLSWYDPGSGMPLSKWPETQRDVDPFVSSVDNAWLEVGLRVTAARFEALRPRCAELWRSMSYNAFLSEPACGSAPGFHVGINVERGALTTSRYSILNSEARIITYLALLKGEVDLAFYKRLTRLPSAAESLTRSPPGRFFPSWGGSMFEALMVPLFVPEDEWSPEGWALSHREYVKEQISCGLEDLECGLWGFSPCMSPSGHYREFGVGALAANGAGYSTGLSGPVVTPHAVFLALPYFRAEAHSALAAMEERGLLTRYGFLDSLNTKTGTHASSILMLDQAMILASIANELSPGAMRRCFTGCRSDVLRAAIAGERLPSERTP